MPSPCRSIRVQGRDSIMNRHSSFILSTSNCYNIRPTLLINPVLRLEFETAPRNVAGNSGMEKAANDNGSVLDTSKTDENYGTISKSNVFGVTNGTGSEGDRGYVGVMEINPTTTGAVVHSHQNSDDKSAAPGYNDNIAVDLGYPNYVVRNGVMNVVEIVDGQYQFRRIYGRLSKIERRFTQDELNNFQEASRTKKCGCR
jgi:hypothetical protein